MSGGNVLQRYQEYIASVAADYPGSTPTKNFEALDKVAALANFANAQQIYVDALSGSDADGTGAILRPYQTLQKALTEIAAAPGSNYLINLAPGDYGGAPIAWPVLANTGIAVKGQSPLNTSISAAITYTSTGASDESFTLDHIAVTTQMVFDLTLGGVVNIIMNDGRYPVKRIDTLPPGPQSIRIFDSFTDNFDTAGTILMLGCQFVGGGTNIVQPTGFLLMDSGVFASMTAQIDGNLALIGLIAQGTTLTGTGTVSADSTSMQSLTIAGPTVAYLDDASTVGFTPATPADWSPAPAEVGSALDQLASNAGAAEKRTSFVFQPGGATGGNTYATWPSLIAAMAANAGPKTIYFDDSLVSPCVIPAGAYALEEVKFDAAIRGKTTSVQVANGVTWTGLRVINNLSIDFQNTAIVETLPAVGLFFDGTSIAANGTSPIWQDSVGCQFQLSSGSSITGSVGANAILVDTGQIFQAAVTTASSINGDALVNGGAGCVYVAIMDASVTFATQVDFSGTEIQTRLDKASGVEYTPAVSGDWSPVPDKVSTALDQLAANAAPIVPTSFVLQPGGTAGENVYTSWASLYAVLLAVSGPKNVFLDDSLGAISIPSGAYNVDGVRFSGKLSTTTLTIDDGATLSGKFDLVENVQVSSNSTTDVCTVTDPNIVYEMGFNCSVTCNAAGAFWRLSSNGVTQFSLHGECFIVNGGNPVFSIDATDSIVIYLYDDSGVDNDSASGAGNIQVITNSNAAFPPTGFSGVTGAVSLIIGAEAATTHYAPANPGDWSVVPDDVAEALDSLAAGGGGGSNWKVYQHTLTAGEVAAKGLTLPETPLTDAEVACDIIGGSALNNGADFSVTGTAVDWTGLGLDGIASTSTTLRFMYAY